MLAEQASSISKHPRTRWIGSLARLLTPLIGSQIHFPGPRNINSFGHQELSLELKILGVRWKRDSPGRVNHALPWELFSSRARMQDPSNTARPLRLSGNLGDLPIGRDLAFWDSFDRSDDILKKRRVLFESAATVFLELVCHGELLSQFNFTLNRLRAIQRPYGRFVSFFNLELELDFARSHRKKLGDLGTPAGNSSPDSSSVRSGGFVRIALLSADSKSGGLHVLRRLCGRRHRRLPRIRSDSGTRSWPASRKSRGQSHCSSATWANTRSHLSDFKSNRLLSRRELH